MPRLRRRDAARAAARPSPSRCSTSASTSYCTVVESAGWICERLGLRPRSSYGGGDRGWIGDNPFIWLDTARIRATGWAPTMTIREAVESTVDYLADNDWILDRVEQRV